jgi:hypothetical protein
MSGLTTEGIELLKFSDATKDNLSNIKSNGGLIPAIRKPSESDPFENVLFDANDLEEAEYDAIVSNTQEMTIALETQTVHSIFVRGTGVRINSLDVHGNKFIHSDGRGPVFIKKLAGNYGSFKVFCHSKFECSNSSDIETRSLYLTTIDECPTFIRNVGEGYIYEKYNGTDTPAGTREYWYSSGEIYVYPDPATETKAGVVKVGAGLSVDNEGKISLEGKPFSDIQEGTPGNGIKNISSDEHVLTVDKEYYVKAGEREEGDDDKEFEAEEVISFNKGYRIKTVSYDNAFVCVDLSEYEVVKPFKVCVRLALRHTIVDVFIVVSSGEINNRNVSCYYSKVGMQTINNFNSIQYGVREKKIYAILRPGSWVENYDVTDAFVTGLYEEQKIKLSFNVPATSVTFASAKQVSYPGLTGHSIDEAAILTVKDGLISKLEIDPESEGKLFVVQNGEIVPLGNIGSENNPVFVKDGKIQKISVSIPNNALLSIQSGAIKQSDANVGSQGKFVYLSDGQLKEANAIVEVTQVINLDANNSIVKINGASVNYNDSKILPAASNWSSVDPSTASVYLIGASASNIDFSSISSLGVGSVVEIFSKDENTVRLSVPSNSQVKWIDDTESSALSKTITVSKHATIVRLPNESRTMVFYIMNEEV